VIKKTDAVRGPTRKRIGVDKTGMRPGKKKRLSDRIGKRLDAAGCTSFIVASRIYRADSRKEEVAAGSRVGLTYKN
jgi:hypothetical protein